MSGVITSTQNETVKEIEKLKTSKGRKEAQAYLLEGVRFLEEALKAGARIRQAFYTTRMLESDRNKSLVDELKAQGVSLQEVSDHVLKKISDTDSPQGIVVVMEKPHIEETALFQESSGIAVLLEEIQDPGNLGTILRTAYAAGVKEIFLSKGTVDPFNPKVLRSTMGAIFNLRLHTGVDSIETINMARSMGYKALVADLDKAEPYYEVDLKDKFLLVMGNEAQGLNPETIEACDKAIKIPMPGGAESLNVSLATGIILFEALRQRAQPS